MSVAAKPWSRSALITENEPAQTTTTVARERCERVITGETLVDASS